MAARDKAASNWFCGKYTPRSRQKQRYSGQNTPVTLFMRLCRKVITDRAVAIHLGLTRGIMSLEQPEDRMGVSA